MILLRTFLEALQIQLVIEMVQDLKLLSEVDDYTWKNNDSHTTRTILFGKEKKSIGSCVVSKIGTHDPFPPGI
jgi:hypothetical protein